MNAGRALKRDHRDKENMVKKVTITRSMWRHERQKKETIVLI